MNPEHIVIEITADTKGLEKTLDLLERLGKISKSDADAYRAMASSSNQFAKSQDGVQKELTQTEKLLSAIALQGQKTNTILENTGKRSGVGTLKKDFSDLDSAISGIGSRIAAVFAAQQLVAFGKEAIGLSAKFNSIRNAINFVQGGAEQGAETFKFLTDLSEKLGLELVSTAQAFKLFSASAQLAGISADDTKEIFESVAGATTALGLTAEDTNGVFLALSQIISKGTVSAEELRGQIGERLPGAFELAAKSMGVTTKELNKMLEQGQLLSKDFLPKFADELKKTFSGALPEAANGAQANLNRLSNAFTNFKVNVGNIFNEAIKAGFELFGDSQDELIEKSRELIKLNKDQATSSQTLLKEYDSLTKTGIVPTAQQKQRLKEITLGLKDALGESVLKINQETGALELNREAVIAAIKQKILLSNQEAGTIAVRIKNAQQEIQTNQFLVKNLADEIILRKQALTQNNLTATQADKYYKTILQGGSAAIALERQLGKSQIDAIKNYQKSTTAFERTNGKITQQTQLVETLTKTLSELGFSAADVENLFGDASSEVDKEVKEIGDSINSLKAKIKQFQDELDPLVDLPKNQKRRQELIQGIKDAQAEIERLSGKLNKKEISDRDSALRKLHELEQKAFEDNLSERAQQINKIVALEQEKNLRLQELVLQFQKATGANLNKVLDEFEKTGRIDISEVFAALEGFKAPEGEMEKFSKGLDDIIEKFTTLQTIEISDKNVKSLRDQFKDAFEFIEEKAKETSDAIDQNLTNKKIQLIAEFKLTGQTEGDFSRLLDGFKKLDKEAKADQLKNAISAKEGELAKAENVNTALRNLGITELIDTKNIQRQITALKKEEDNQQVEDFTDATEERIAQMEREKQKQQELLNQIANFSGQALSLATTAVNNYFDAEAERIEENTRLTLESYDQRADALDRMHDQNKIGDRQYEASRQNLEARRKAEEKKADDERKKLKKKQSDYNKALAIADATINTAVAVTANLEFPILAAAIAALGAAEIAIIASETVPGYAKGVEKVTGKGTSTSDEVPAKLSVGERVVTAEKNRRFWPILSAIHNNRIDHETINHLATMPKETLRSLVKTDSSVVRELANMQPVFLKHESITRQVVLKNDLATQTNIHERPAVIPKPMNENDMAWVLKTTGLSLQDVTLNKLGKVIANNIPQNPYASHRK